MTATIIPIGTRNDQIDRPPENTTSAVVRHFTQSLNLCSVCGSTKHRASKCPLRNADA